MASASPEKIKQCKKIAWIGIAVMGIGSFTACLPQSQSLTYIGTAILLAGIAISYYGFKYWRP